MSRLYDPQRVAEILDSHDADGIVALHAPNVRYLTNLTKATAAAAFVSRESLTAPVLIVPSADADYVVEDLAPGTSVYAYGEFYRHVEAHSELLARERLVLQIHEASDRKADRNGRLASQLAAYGLGGGRVITDAGPSELTSLESLLPNLQVDFTAGVFKALRAVKTREEIVRLQRAASVTESAIAETAAVVTEGATQFDLAAIFIASIARSGLALRMANVSIGRSGALGNANVPVDVIRRGSIIRFDVGAIAEGYASDIARCFAYKGASEPSRRYHAALVAGQETALELIRPGVTAREVFEVAVTTVRQSGIPHYERTHVGHGIGIHGDGYDPPILSRDSSWSLEEGMVLCIETPYYELGFGGFQVEDMVVVTGHGIDFLTKSSRGLTVLE